MTEKELLYRQTPAINYSTLSDLAGDPTKVNLNLGDKGYFHEGKLAECLLFNPEEFDNDFYIGSDDLPSETIQKIVKNYYNECPDTNFEDNPDTIYYYIKQEGYYDKRTKDWHLQNIIKEGSEFYTQLRNSTGKVIISKELYNKYYLAVPFIKNSLFYKELFKEDLEILKTVPIYFEYRGEFCKILLDIILVDKKNKNLIPVDLKTVFGKEEDNFEKNYFKLHYYLQGSFYSLGLGHHPLVTDYGYTIKPFTFFVLRKDNLNNPVTFEMSIEDLKVGQVGGRSLSGKNIEVKGYDQLINEFKWHRDNNIWDYLPNTFKNKKRILNMFIP